MSAALVNDSPSTTTTSSPSGYVVPTSDSTQDQAVMQLQNTVVLLLDAVLSLQTRMDGVETTPFVSPQLAYLFANR